MDLMFEISVIEKKSKWRIDLIFDDAVLKQWATCRVNALLPANQNQALLNKVE